MPIRLLAYESGADDDFMSRIIIAEGPTASFGQPVIADNRPAAMALDIASKASSDGYTLIAGATSFWLGPLLREARLDPAKDHEDRQLALF